VVWSSWRGGGLLRLWGVFWEDGDGGWERVVSVVLDGCCYWWMFGELSLFSLVVVVCWWCDVGWCGWREVVWGNSLGVRERAGYMSTGLAVVVVWMPIDWLLLFDDDD